VREKQYSDLSFLSNKSCFLSVKANRIKVVLRLLEKEERSKFYHISLACHTRSICTIYDNFFNQNLYLVYR